MFHVIAGEMVTLYISDWNVWIYQIAGLKDNRTSLVHNQRFENITWLIESRIREAIERENVYLTTPSPSNQ